MESALYITSALNCTLDSCQLCNSHNARGLQIINTNSVYIRSCRFENNTLSSFASFGGGGAFIINSYCKELSKKTKRSTYDSNQARTKPWPTRPPTSDNNSPITKRIRTNETQNVSLTLATVEDCRRKQGDGTALYFVLFLAQASRGTNCSLCMESEQGDEDCVLVPVTSTPRQPGLVVPPRCKNLPQREGHEQVGGHGSRSHPKYLSVVMQKTSLQIGVRPSLLHHSLVHHFYKKYISNQRSYTLPLVNYAWG